MKTGEQLAVVINTRLTAADANRIRAEAERRDMTVSDYVRWAVMQPVGQPIIRVTSTVDRSPLSPCGCACHGLRCSLCGCCRPTGGSEYAVSGGGW